VLLRVFIAEAKPTRNIFRDDLVSIDDGFIRAILISSNKTRPGSAWNGIMWNLLSGKI